MITLLELLGKADNIPFNQLYNLAMDCADRYYTNVIRTLTCLLKSSFTNRQMVLVNSAQALKFLESYRDCQTKLSKVLSKYHQLSDHFHYLKHSLQTEFNLLKEATSRNTASLQESIKLQQTYITTLSAHINTIYIKLAQLEKQIQTDCMYPHSQPDTMQSEAPDYDSDIDGNIDKPSPLTYATTTQVKTTSTNSEPGQEPTLPQDPLWTTPEPTLNEDIAQHPISANNGPIPRQYQERERQQLENIPEIEEED